jgi:hypothetical protein
VEEDIRIAFIVNFRAGEPFIAIDGDTEAGMRAVV